MLLITGTPRSGTTLLAAFCKMIGHDPGGDMKDGFHAGLEDFSARIPFEAMKRNPGFCD
jgi:hypothetical protein